MRRWFRMFMRRRTSPMSVSYAQKRKESLSIAYMFFAWNGGALMIYQCIKEGFPMTEEEKKQPGRYYARMWQGKDVQVYHVDGFTVTKHYNVEGIPNLEPPEEEFQQKCDEELVC